MAEVILFTGGARSGKSRLAQERLTTLGSVVYIATAQALDDEMRARIRLHQSDRPAGWATIEEPLDLAAALVRAIALKPQGILIDCLTLWLANQLLKLWGSGWASVKESEVLILLEAALQKVESVDDLTLVIVTNEVGCGIVPTNEMARAYRDLVGRANQFVAMKSNEVHFVTAGLRMKLK